MTMEESVDGPRGQGWATFAFLLLVTSLWLPWWGVAWDDGSIIIRDDVRTFRHEPPLTTTWAPWLTGGLVVAAALLLFVRVAARSHRHEPEVWQRDLVVCASLVAAALLSCLLWPAGVPSFWGGRTYMEANVTTQVTETSMPGLGWWLVVASLFVLGVARWRSRRPAGRAQATAGEESDEMDARDGET